MEATPVAQQSGHSARLQFLFENHPFRHLVRAAELLRASRDRVLSHARSHLEAAKLVDEPFAGMYRGVAETYVSIARQRNRRLVHMLIEMREVSP
jgi:hypothetical protein